MRYFSSQAIAANCAIMLTGIFAVTPGSAAHAQIVTSFLYVTDYGNKNLDRYSFSFNEATQQIMSSFAPDGFNNNTTSALLVSGNVKEGLQGTSDDLIVVEGTGGAIGRYDLNGNKIGDITVTGFPAGITSLLGVGNVAITSNGKYMYAPDETAGYIYKINLATGHIDNYVAMTQPHDVVIGSDGAVYAGSWQSSTGIQTFTSNLTYIKTLVAPGTISNSTGFALTENSSGNTTGFYVMSHPVAGISNAAEGGPDSVYHFALSGTGATETATLLSDPSSANLEFSFGDDIGPDGNLYCAELGGYFGYNSGYTGGVYELNTSTDAVSLAIAGAMFGSSTPGPSGLDAPKYLEFSTNFIKAPDAGAVPEPGNIALLAGIALGGMGLLVRRKRRKE